jgi:hypothetical protein
MILLLLIMDWGSLFSLPKPNVDTFYTPDYSTATAESNRFAASKGMQSYDRLPSTGSMAPYMDENTTLVTEPITKDTVLGKGDVVFYKAPWSKTGTVTHMIWGVHDGGKRFTTIGSNSAIADPGFVPRESITHVVRRVYRFGDSPSTTPNRRWPLKR